MNKEVDTARASFFHVSDGSQSYANIAVTLYTPLRSPIKVNSPFRDFWEKVFRDAINGAKSIVTSAGRLSGIHMRGVSLQRRFIAQDCPILCIGKRLVHIVFVTRRDRSVRLLNNGGEILPTKMNAGARYINSHRYRRAYHSRLGISRHRKHGHEGSYRSYVYIDPYA